MTSCVQTIRSTSWSSPRHSCKAAVELQSGQRQALVDSRLQVCHSNMRLALLSTCSSNRLGREYLSLK